MVGGRKEEGGGGKDVGHREFEWQEGEWVGKGEGTYPA